MKNLEANIAYSYLLGHSGSPLRHALETAEFAASISPLTMLDDSGREIRVITGVVTNDAKFTTDTENLIISTLEKVVEDGVLVDEANGILDRIEMSIRELGSGYPYGLSLILQAVGAATHDENMKNMLDPTELLEILRAKIQDPRYIAEIIRENFLMNQHRTILTAIPSEKAVQVEQELEKNYLKNIQSQLSETDIAEIKRNTEILEANQKAPQDMELLPKILMTDISPEMKTVPGRQELADNRIHYATPTNRLNYIKYFYPLSALNLNEIFQFSLMSSLLGELGFDGKKYTDAQKIIAEKLSFSASWILYKHYGTDEVKAIFATNGKFLERNTNDALEIIESVTNTTRFDETDQIRNLFSEKLLTLKSELTSSGNATAIRRASQGHTILGRISETLHGIESMENMKNFLKKADAEITENFTKLHAKTHANPPLILTVASENFLEKTPENTFQEPNFLEENFETFRTNEAWLTDLAVGYAALSVKVVPASHEDAPLFVLLGQFLRDGYLHTAIRERGGAYGSGAKYDGSTESFQFFSYRDPRIEGTYADFAKSIEWLLETEHDNARLDEAKIGVIAKIDTPSSPANEAFADAIDYIKHYTIDIQNRERQTILDATIDDLKRIAKLYLSNLENASRVVITGKQNRAEVEKM